MNEKFDKLDALILLAGDVLIEEELAYAREVLDPEIEISKRTDRRILRYIRHTQKKPGYHPVLDVMKRVAVVVLVIGTVLFASAMSIDAVREKFWNAIVEWYEDYIAVMFVDDAAEDTMANVEFEVREPSYLPNGFTKGRQIKKDFSCSTIYIYNEQEVLFLEQLMDTTSDLKIDNNCIATDIMVNKYPGILIEYSNTEHYYTIIWKDEYYYYKLSSLLEHFFKEEALNIASSIYD